MKPLSQLQSRVLGTLVLCGPFLTVLVLPEVIIPSVEGAYGSGSLFCKNPGLGLILVASAN